MRYQGQKRAGDTPPQVTHLQAVVGLRDIVESWDSCFKLGFHVEVPMVSHELTVFVIFLIAMIEYLTNET